MSVESENELDGKNPSEVEGTVEGKNGGHETDHGTSKSLRAFEREVESRSRAGPSTPERQELHKGPERIPESQPGGPHRPSWRAAPEPTEAEKATTKGEGHPTESDDTASEAASELGRKHLVPGTVLAGADQVIARSVAESESRISGREVTPTDWRVLKGDAGEGRTYVDLLSRYERERILRQPRLKDSDMERQPDFAISSARDSGKLAEIVDSKAWSLVRPRDKEGRPVSQEEFSRYLLEKPDASGLLNLAVLQKVVEEYASSPRLEPDGKVVLYFPENVIRYAPQVKHEIEGWSMTETARGHAVEVRSMGVWEDEIESDLRERLKRLL